MYLWINSIKFKKKKKRLTVKEIENKDHTRFSSYIDEFDYLVNSRISLEVKAISNPIYPLKAFETKNLLKLYLNDVGLLSNILYKYNNKPILDSIDSINLGSVYENVVASELIAHNYELYYYDNRKKGKVDFLIDDYKKSLFYLLKLNQGKIIQHIAPLTTFFHQKNTTLKMVMYYLTKELYR